MRSEKQESSVPDVLENSLGRAELCEPLANVHFQDEIATLHPTPDTFSSRREGGIDFVDGGSVVFSLAVAIGNSFHEVEHRRNKKDRDEGRREHSTDDCCT